MLAYAPKRPSPTAAPTTTPTEPAAAGPMNVVSYAEAAPLQRTVIKQSAGRWVSDRNPYRVFPTKALAQAYDRLLRTRERLKARVPTLYTYTHTKPHNKLSMAKQGPHVVAHRVTLHRLQKVGDVKELRGIFKKHVMSPKILRKVIKKEGPSGGYQGTMAPRIQRYLDDYQQLHDDAVSELGSKKPDQITATHYTNQLLNLSPFATYGWKTTTNASKKSLSGKGENKANPDFDDLVDPPKVPFKSTTEYQEFLDGREEMFDDL